MLINHDVHIEKEIFEMYDRIEMGKHSVCKACQEANVNLTKPVSFWFVGEKYYNSQYRVLFVGKNARGKVGSLVNDYYNSTLIASSLWQKSWPYWSYTRAISESLYGTEDGDYIAFTNIIKCNNSDTVDTTTLWVSGYYSEETQFRDLNPS